MESPLVSHPKPTSSPSAAVVSEYAPYMVATYSRPPPVFVHGHMSWLWDVEGQRYLDFTAGIAVNSLGHCDKEFSRILRYQGSTLIHASNLYYNPWTGTLSKLLVEKTRESGGMHDAAAVFAGIKFARKVGKVLDPSGEKTRDRDDGRPVGDAETPSIRRRSRPWFPDFGWARTTTRRAASSWSQSKGKAACSWRNGAARLGLCCTTTKSSAGCRGRARSGRTAGLPEAHPDILTDAEALGTGFPSARRLPMSWRWGRKYPELITEIRGRGLILGLQLTRDPTDIVNACLEKGLLVITAGTNTLRFVPALNITEKLIVAGLKMLDSAIASVLNPSSTPEASAPEASPTPEA
ncbi:acetylornithine aminotransferase-like protein [Apodospora peruviana]|uniref:Acetylornithine aminotransferase-like protein n=1 Tax=Apodospora peruviana TaxID=516989 RepID=A0AAE0LYN9_9PEZI|nr:acetylornithine aminotransferase-like protein [Apodospora peruviana]